MESPSWLPSGLIANPPKLLACRMLPVADPALRKALGGADHHVSLGFVTCDQDDPTYAALDHATKMADVRVLYARSFYAGSAHASPRVQVSVAGLRVL